MDHPAARLIQRSFRKEPILSMVVTIGLVNALLGSLQGQVLLAVLGVLVVGGSLSWRTWHRRRSTPMAQRSMRYLPDQSSRPQMPMVGLSSKRQSSR